MVKKTRKGFDDALTAISLWGFALIALSAFFGIDLGIWTTGVIMIIAGTGLAVEGQILTARKWIGDGLQSKEFTMFVTLVLGVITIIAGFLSLPLLGIVSEKLVTVNGLVSILAFIFIALQRWFIN